MNFILANLQSMINVCFCFWIWLAHWQISRLQKRVSYLESDHLKIRNCFNKVMYEHAVRVVDFYIGRQDLNQEEKDAFDKAKAIIIEYHKLYKISSH